MKLFQGSYGFWKVREIDNAIFEDLESFEQGKFFIMSIEMLWIFD